MEKKMKNSWSIEEEDVEGFKRKEKKGKEDHWWEGGYK